MSHFSKKSLIVLVAIMLLVPTLASAQLAGQRINPNVMLLLDTGRGMNWTRDNSFGPPMSAEERVRTAIQACHQMNREDGYSHDFTTWQIVAGAHLGSATDSKYLHCFYADADIRPNLKMDTLSGFDPSLTGTLLYDQFSEVTREYWFSNREPHLRLVNCYDPREPGNRGDWNTEYDQCIGSQSEINSIPSVVIHTRSRRRYWCQLEVDGQPNYVVDSSGREICFNYHPRALPNSSDGILERYRSLARFGVMTFDNTPSPTSVEAADWNLTAQHRSGWDYGENVEWYILAYEQRNPTMTQTRAWNSGVRGDFPQAIGRMVRLSDDIEMTNQAVSSVIDSVEPLHCSFRAGMLDDAGQYTWSAPEVRPAYNHGSDLFFNCRPRLAIFITDGIQPETLEFSQDYCNRRNNAPPPPWGSGESHVGDNAPYDCPFNSSYREAEELFRVVPNLVNGAGLGLTLEEVEPTYLVVIGVNMRGKEAGGPNRCDGTPTWSQGKCLPPGNDCLVINENLTSAQCVENHPDYLDAFDTPRQYLNRIALTGWPEDSGAAPFLLPAAGGTFQQPPWRIQDPDDPSVMVFPWCDAHVDNCGGEINDGMVNGAVFVNSREDLAMVLDNIMNGAVFDETGTRTELVPTNITAPGEVNAVAQYVFNSGYHAVAGQPWAGILLRQGYACSDAGDTTGGAVDTALVDFHQEMVTRGSDARNLYILNPALNEQPDLMYGTTELYKKGHPTALVEFSVDNLNDCVFGAPSAFCGTETRMVERIADYLVGKRGKRIEKPLGDIYNSSPFILPPPRERIPISSYEEFVTGTHNAEGEDGKPNVNRQPYLYVGTNDGILHSFNAWARSDKRIEGWGFVPSPLIGNIGTQFPVSIELTFDALSGVVNGYNVISPATSADEKTGTYQRIFGVDAPPLAADVLLYRNGQADEKDYWRSLVLGGLGKGGYGYFCLDVTENPESKPSYRWQLSPTHFSVNGNHVGARAAISEMGLAISRPELAYVYYEAEAPREGASTPELHQVAVAILPGGYVGNESGGMGVSTGVYLVRAIDGKLIRYLKTTVADDLCHTADLALLDDSALFKFGDDSRVPLARVAQLVGQPVVPNAIRTGKVADEAYIGDDRGRLWRIDMSSRDSDDWCIEPFFDTLIAEHFPYKDCLNATSGTPGSGAACCTPKENDVGHTCPDADLQVFQADGKFGIDACSGQACVAPNQAFPFPLTPILAPPTIVQDEDRNNVLLFGTGHIDGLATLNHNRVFSLTVTPEITVSESMDPGKNVSRLTRSQPSINWWIGEDVLVFPLGKHTNTSAGIGYIENQMFPPDGADPTRATGTATTHFDFWGLGEKQLGRIAVFDQGAYFTSFTPLDKAGSVLDACNSGGSKIWGVQFNGSPGTAFGQLPHPDPMIDEQVAYYERDKQVLTGLRMVRRPSCDGTEGFMLMVQSAQPPSGATSPASMDSSTAPISSESIQVQTPGRGFTRVGIDSWSIVLGGR